MPYVQFVGDLENAAVTSQRSWPGAAGYDALSGSASEVIERISTFW